MQMILHFWAGLHGVLQMTVQSELSKATCVQKLFITKQNTQIQNKLQKSIMQMILHYSGWATEAQKIGFIFYANILTCWWAGVHSAKDLVYQA